jgi:hypothetical protein
MADTGWKFHATSANGTTGEDWQNRANAANDADSDAVMTKVSGTATESLFYDYTFGLPAGATINGIEVEGRGRDTFGDAGWVLELYASWNGGTTWTAVKRFPASGDFPPASGTAFQVRNVGGAADTWGRTWTDSEFSNSNFRLRINYLTTGDGGASEVAIDYIKLKVYYTAGASAIKRWFATMSGGMRDLTGAA